MQTMQNILTKKIRVYLYLLSFSMILFGQHYCINACSFIDGLQADVLTRNLFFIAIAHIAIREILYAKFSTSFKPSITLSRHGYYLSIISWILAGVVALVLHASLYPHFPLGSHAKLMTGYIVLGGAIIAQLEYLLFEKEYYSQSTQEIKEKFNEKFSNRITETLLIFVFAPALIVVIILGRYTFEGTLPQKVSLEVFLIEIFFMVVIAFVVIILRKHLQTQTAKLIDAIDSVKKGNYPVEQNVKSSDEFGQISSAISSMSYSIKEGIDKNEALNQEIIDTQKEIIYTMGTIAESRSKETGNHVKRVALYSQVLALAVGMDEEEAERLKLASPMHDIGKVAIPDEILNKPARLTPEEFEVMKTHAQIGYEMLKHSNRDIIKTAAIVAGEHHEKWNGKGYPKGLKGEEIHIYGRITAVADVFDALGSDRKYKKAWEDEKVFSFLKEESGEHFDPKIIELFFENLDEILEIRDRYNDI